MQADVANFPLEWMVNSLAQEGGQATINGQNYNFTGLGNAQQALTQSAQADQAQLALQQQYGPAYVQQALSELQQADPTGYAARQQLGNAVVSGAQNIEPAQPLSVDLQNQVNNLAQNAGQLDPEALQQVQQGVRAGQAGSGIYLGNAPASQEAGAVVGAADQLQNQQQSAAESYLAAGVSPQDVQYRRIQQSLSNLGAFQNNQTPEAQFGELSAAGQGAAPFSVPNYSTPTTLNPSSAAQTGIGFANANYQTSQQLANPWLSGLSIGANGFNAASNFGSSLGQLGGTGMPTSNSVFDTYPDNPSPYDAATNFGMVPTVGTGLQPGVNVPG
jgi:hypothetical protein